MVNWILGRYGLLLHSTDSEPSSLGCHRQSTKHHIFWMYTVTGTIPSNCQIRARLKIIEPLFILLKAHRQNRPGRHPLPKPIKALCYNVTFTGLCWRAGRQEALPPERVSLRWAEDHRPHRPTNKQQYVLPLPAGQDKGKKR